MKCIYNIFGLLLECAWKLVYHIPVIFSPLESNPFFLCSVFVFPDESLGATVELSQFDL